MFFHKAGFFQKKGKEEMRNELEWHLCALWPKEVYWRCVALLVWLYFIVRHADNEIQATNQIYIAILVYCQFSKINQFSKKNYFGPKTYLLVPSNTLVHKLFPQCMELWNHIPICKCVKRTNVTFMWSLHVDAWLMDQMMTHHFELWALSGVSMSWSIV